MDTKKHIILISLRFFLKYGYKDTSLSKVADEVGIKKSSIYYHFKNKEDLFIKSIKYLINEFDKVISDSIDNLKSSKTMLWNIYSSLIDFNKMYLGDQSNSMNILYLFYVANKKFPEKLEEDIQGHYDNLSDTVDFIIRLGQKRGEIKQSYDHKILTYKIISWLEGVNVFSYFYNEANKNFSRKELFDNIWDMINIANDKTDSKTMPKTISLGTKW